LNALDSSHPAAFLAGQVADVGVSDAADAVLSAGTSGSGGSLVSGGGGGRGFFDDLDEAALVILAIVAVAIVLIVAIPLGIMAVEVVFALLAILLGICLRVAHVRPWTILVRHDSVTTAAFSVKGWRSSKRMLVGLREQSGSLARAKPHIPASAEPDLPQPEG
jgi:hypothetical protein